MAARTTGTTKVGTTERNAILTRQSPLSCGPRNVGVDEVLSNKSISDISRQALALRLNLRHIETRVHHQSDSPL